MQSLWENREISGYPALCYWRNKMEKTKIRRTLFGLALCLALLLAACASQRMPPDAEQALLDYWASLPSSSQIENTITRSWRGDTSTAELQPGMEVWCVDAGMSTDNPETDGQTLRWIVVRTGEDAPWTATLLAAMSSTWPYEACGE